MYNRYTIHITKKCNFNCDYCYIDDKNISDIPFEDIIKNVDIIMHEIINNKQQYIEIEFLGGEPLLKINIIDYCCKYIEQNYDIKVKYLITTNMSIISQEIIDILIKYNFYVGISIDGTSFMHNMSRHFLNGKGTYNTVIKNSLKLKKQVLTENICIQLTLHKFNIGYLYEGIENLYQLGFNKINLGIVNKDINDDFLFEYENQCMKIIDNLYMFDKLYIISIMENIKYKVEYEYDENKSIIIEKFKYNNNFLSKIDLLKEKIYNYYIVKRG
jgi:sulfatase maturation enzyme AslB (radical SAM superfamily)